jgi:pyroglutamyl-peptidase
LEKIAINYRNASIVDNEGNMYQGVKIDEKGSDGIFVNLEVERLSKISESEVSLTAGAFICNDLMYMLLNHYGNSIKMGFIHVPYLPQQDNEKNASMELEEIIKKLTLIHREFIGVNYEV